MYQARTTWVDHVWHRCGVYCVFVTPCWWFYERIVSTHCTAGHVKFRWTWQQRKGNETGARGWAMLSTLCKLRHNFSQEDLAMRFGVNQSTMSRLYSCWTKFWKHASCVSPLALPPPPPLEAILVIFGRRALIFFVWKLLEKNEKWHHFCAHTQWRSPWRRKNVENGHLAPSNLTFLLIAIDTNGFRRIKEEELVYKR